MQLIWILAGVLPVLLVLSLLGGCAAEPMSLTPEPHKLEVPKFGLFEIKLRGSAKPANPFTDVAASASFASPSGKTIRVDGFYYGGDEWRVRFVPREQGQWRYEASLQGASPADKVSGAFECRGVSGHGFLKLSQRNVYRMEYDDGTPYYPIGIQTCNFLQPDFDGPTADGKWRSVSPEEWAKAFEGAVTLVRTQMGQGTTAGCALPLIPSPHRNPHDTAPATASAPAEPPPLDRYDTALAAQMDHAFVVYRGHGMAQMLILFQDMSLWGAGPGAFGHSRDIKTNKTLSAENLPLQEKYIRYIVARFGCFVDIWELFNEDSYAPNDYLAHLADVVRKADPYGHIVTTNYARPGEKWCELVTWHEYMALPASEVDAYLCTQIALFKSYNKVVQNTEFGNQGGLSNDDPVKWRIAVWTAFMNESGMLFWGMSGNRVKEVKNGNANAYIGADSRQFFRVLTDFSRGMPVDMKPVPCGYHNQRDVRTYALSNGKVTAIYVHHFADHEKEYQYPGKLMVLTGPGRFRARWIDAATGAELRTDELSTPQHYLELKVPPVKVDIACRVDRVSDTTQESKQN